MRSIIKSAVSLFILTFSLGLAAQNVTVKGTVMDDSNVPLIGATVKVIGTTTGAVTDSNGNYSITAAPDATLEATYLGYISQVIPIAKRAVIDFILKEDSDYLDEVVVVFCFAADADDVVLDEWLNTFMSNTEGVDMVCQGMILDYTLMKDTEPIPNKILAVDYEGAVSGGLDSLHKHGLRGSTCLKLFRKSIIDDHNLRFNVAYNYMEDEEFILRYMQYCNNIKSVSKANYYYFYLGYQQLKKYSIQNSYKLFRSLYMSARNIYGNADSVVLDYYVDELTASLLASFRNSFNLSL